jgi:dipeptidyl aminopeptidase/acylaminoacyl peptidase
VTERRFEWGALAVVLTVSACSTSAIGPTPTPRATPTHSQPTTSATAPAPSPSPAAEWRLIGDGSSLQVEWSPDGSHLLVSDVQSSPESRTTLNVVDLEGEVAASIDDASHGEWLDADHFFAYRDSTKPKVRKLGTASAFFGSLQSGDVDEREAPFGSALGNGRGAVALAGDPEQPSFVVWSGEDVSQPRPGYPVAWSLAGDRIAVLHPSGSMRGVSGWLEVVSWPEMETVFEDQSRTVISDLWFDPAGQYVAFPTFSEERPTPLEHLINVVELSTGQLTKIPVNDHTGFRWNAKGEIVAQSALERVDVYTPTGQQVSSQPIDDYTGIRASADGSTLLLFAEDENEDVTMAVGQVGGLVPVALPEEGKVSSFSLSPDGDYLAIVIGGSRQGLYVRDVGTD